MQKTLTLARRELAGYFFSPMAYVIGAVVLAVTAVIFFFGFELIGIPKIFQAGNEASLRPLFEALAYVMIFAAPLLTKVGDPIANEHAWGDWRDVAKYENPGVFCTNSPADMRDVATG